jgi:hypothetical protein
VKYAVSQANSGDTINVAAGTYTGVDNREILVSSKDLIISGAGSTNTIIELNKQGNYSIIAIAIITLGDSNEIELFQF